MAADDDPVPPGPTIPRPNAIRPASGSLLHRWWSQRQPHPDSFVCGVRLLSGDLARTSSRWRYRLSAVDPLRTDDAITVRHGHAVTLRIRPPQPETAALRRDPRRTGHVVVEVTETVSGARLALSIPVGEAARFGIEL